MQTLTGYPEAILSDTFPHAMRLFSSSLNEGSRCPQSLPERHYALLHVTGHGIPIRSFRLDHCPVSLSLRREHEPTGVRQ